jgi:hypothetical protein
VKDDQEMAAQSWESSVTLVVYDNGYMYIVHGPFRRNKNEEAILLPKTLLPFRDHPIAGVTYAWSYYNTSACSINCPVNYFFISL